MANAGGAGPRVMVAMSGGVDSSVAAALLVQQGYEVIGVTMQIWPADLPGAEKESGCCSLSAVEDARRVCDRLDIPYYVFDFQESFREWVIRPFADSYLRGRTPNPCILCNEKVKFGELLAKAEELDCQFVATGHYARVAHGAGPGGRHELRRSKDLWKDQTYALYGLTQEQLSRTLLPVGSYTKPEIRRMASQWGLVNARKPDSQEICFVMGDYRSFLREAAPESLRPGDIVDTQGRVLGRHEGIAFYTVGQRKGLAIAAGEPLYVVRIDAERNQVVVGRREEAQGRGLVATRVNWVSVAPPESPLRVTAKIRHGAAEAPAVIEPLAGGRVRCRFDEPQWAITPGQSVVWYDGERVVGGGVIESAVPEQAPVHEEAAPLGEAVPLAETAPLR